MNEDSPPPGATAAAGDRDDGRGLAPHRGWIVVVLNYQGQADTLECLRSLRAGGCPDRAILVVDNASGGDDARVIAERFSAVPLLALDTNGGFAGGNNRGFLAAKAAGARHVLFLNNDTVVEEGFLDALADFAEGRPDAAVFVPKICWYHQPDRIWFGGGRFSYWTARASTAGWRAPDSPRFSELREIDWATGCALAVRVDAVGRPLVFDARYFAYNEDLELSLFLRQRGHAVLYAPVTRVLHKDSASFGRSGTLRLKLFLSTRNLLWTLRAYLRPYHWPTAAVGFLVGHVLRFAVLCTTRRDWRGLIGLAAGILAGVRRPAPSDTGRPEG